ncbi:MAG TPA: hypothetical protein VMF08_04785 [Candidatus Sulfotelmatobacter sp.]|nr:hypothetical protein [Candidatus Sulfotelmatobacter sp.]
MGREQIRKEQGTFHELPVAQESVPQTARSGINAASSRVFPKIQKSKNPFIQPSELSPRSRLMGGQFAETPSKTHILCVSVTPMALATPFFSLIRRTFVGKTVFKTQFFDHRKGQFLLCQCHRRNRRLYSNPAKTAKNLMLRFKSFITNSLRICCGFVADLLHFKLLVFNDVADVAGFQTSHTDIHATPVPSFLF